METIQDLGAYTFPALLQNTMKKFADRPALSLVNGEPITYTQLNEASQNVAKMLKTLGLKKGDKVAIFGNGRPEWGEAYLGIVNYGLIAVPLLPDFSESEVQAILAHCQVQALIISEKLESKIKNIQDQLPPIIIKLEALTITKGGSGSINDFTHEPLPVSDVKEDDTASIIYTSGTTGRSKGVELSHKNLVWNAVKGQDFHRINKLDRVLSFLPVSHVYEFTIDFTMMIMNGACVYYLGKPPVVSALLPAFAKIQPTIVCAVPLIMEKIYKAKVLPAFEKNAFIKTLYHIKPFKKLLHRAAGKQLKKTFGGHLVFFGIGGSKVDPVVERFMKDAKFPYAIGYGLTETAPLLAGSGVKVTIPGTVGPLVKDLDLRLLNKDPVTGIGEVVVKGPNVMKGYYKDPELTAQAFTTSDDDCGEGYFKTGDLGTIEMIKGMLRLSLKGRSKNMILGPSGENIYPEDIEFVLNQHPLVSESLVVEDDNGLVALVQVNEEKLQEQAEKFAEKPENMQQAIQLLQTNITKNIQSLQENVQKFPEKFSENVQKLQEDFSKSVDEFKRDTEYQKEALLNEIQFFVNSRVNKNSHINKVQEVEQFEKTASQKIKRYLYDLRTKNKKK